MTKSTPINSNVKQPAKACIVESLLVSAKGASLDEIAAATGWQPHSCRAFLTGLRKKGHNIIRDKRKDGTSYYRIEKTTIKDGAAELEQAISVSRDQQQQGAA